MNKKSFDFFILFEETRPLRAGFFQNPKGPSSKLGPAKKSQALRPGFILVIFLLLQSGAIFAQTPPATPTTQITPADLSPEWWKSLTEKKELQNRLEEIQQSIDDSVKNLSQANRAKAEVLIKEIKINWNNYLKISDQPIAQPPQPPPLLVSYSLEKLIEINNAHSKLALQLEGRKEERSEIQRVIDNLNARLDLVRQNYSGTEKRSEERILLGLETMSLVPAIDVAKIKLNLINQTIENETKSLKYLTEEVETAKDRLVSSDIVLRQLARQLDPKLRLWDEAKKNRQQLESSQTTKYSDEQTEEAKIQNDHLSQLQIEADLNEIAAHNAYLRAEILYTLSVILNEPTNINISSTTLTIKDWETQLSILIPQINQWGDQTERIVNRTTQLLSLDEKKPTLKSDQERDLLKKNVSLGQKNLLEIQRLKKEIEETYFLHAVTEEKVAYLQGNGKRWLRKATDFFYDLIVFIRGKFGVTLFHIGSHPVTPFAILQFALIMIVTWWLSKFLVATLNSIARNRKGIRKAVIYRINKLFRYLLLVIGLLIALTSIGFDFSNLVIIAGALGIGIGFGLQNIFNDFISGLIILFQSHLKVGDFIVIDKDLRGEIREINVRSTVITTNDGVDVLVPNSVLVSSRIVNWTLRDPYKRLHVPFFVAYESDVDEVTKLVVEAANKVPSTLKKIGVPEPQVFMKGFGENALEMELVVWVDEKGTRRFRKTRSLYLLSIEKTLKKHGIRVPFPQRDLHIIPK